jgi:hypothetical protein
MKSQNLRSSLIRVAIGVALGCAVAASGCGDVKPTENTPIGGNNIPTTPVPMPGHAQVSGVVRDGNGQSVAGATIKVAEMDAMTTSDAAGAYSLMVPSDSTLTLITTAAGFATSFRESIVLADGAMADGLDLMLMPAAEVGRMVELGPMDATMRGLVAVHLHSMDASCLTAGAHLSVWPPKAATVVYGSPSASGGLDDVDPALSGVEAGARVDAWLAGALPPGNMFLVNVEQPGCTVVAQAPSMGGLMFTGQRRVDAAALTEIDLFLQAK